MPVTELPPEALYHRCAPEHLPFVTTEELAPLSGLFGQERALEAIRFGTRIEHGGYNLFVLGHGSAGHDDAVEDLLRALAREESAPSDWVYVTNFDDAMRPRALRLSPGDGRRLHDLVRRAVKELRSALPAIFQSEEYLTRRKAIEDSIEQRHREALSRIQARAEAEGIALVSTQNGIGVAAIKDGEVMKPEEFAVLPEAERNAIERKIDEIQDQIEEVFRAIPRWEGERVEKLRELNKEFANFAVARAVTDLQAAFPSETIVHDWVRRLGEDIVENVAVFAPEAAEQAGEEGRPGSYNGLESWQEPFDRYKVNLFIDNGRAEGAPVIDLDHPSLGNLLGRVEYRSQMGALVTDATLIRPGALHHANGGYLIVDAMKILRDPLAWDALKRALRRMQITVESPAEYYGMASTVMLEPEPIPLDVKVVLYGPPALYHVLCGREPDFPKLFKVQVEFSTEIDRTAETVLYLARVIGSFARDNGLKPLSPAGVARVVEDASRRADDGEKLSILLEPLGDLLREADYQAREMGHPVIGAEHVSAALKAREARADSLRDRYMDFIGDDVKLIDTDGARAGQINSLFVHSLPNFRFGSPSRVTAQVRPAGVGGMGVQNIERTVGFGRRVYAKGVEILNAWFLAKFSAERPPQFTATIAHEQNYGPIDGDSASSTEVYVLLSALADVPISQAFAVTGSVNQFGEVQMIGGVNEKIEGFFDVCDARGLTGEQGVMIPAGNARELMLREDVVAAVRAGQFHIYPITTIEEGIEVLTGMPAGEPDDDGAYPEDTIYGRVQRRLKAFSRPRGAGGGNGEGNGGPKRRRWFFW